MKFFIRSLPPKMGIPLYCWFDEQGDGYGRRTERGIKQDIESMKHFAIFVDETPEKVFSGSSAL